VRDRGEGGGGRQTDGDSEIESSYKNEIKSFFSKHDIYIVNPYRFTKFYSIFLIN
jgi:hypothetical protein